MTPEGHGEGGRVGRGQQAGEPLGGPGEGPVANPRRPGGGTPPVPAGVPGSIGAPGTQK